MTRFYLYKLVPGDQDHPYRLVAEVICADEQDASDLAKVISGDGQVYMACDADHVDLMESTDFQPEGVSDERR